MTIDMIKVRARIAIGTTLIVETPYVQSFNVRRARGAPSTFDASLKVHNDNLSQNIGGTVSISAGEKGNLKQIFTGILMKASFAPCWTDPGFVFFNISGMDAMYLLQGKKYTRRCRATLATWVSIDGVVRPGLRTGKLSYVDEGVTLSAGAIYRHDTESATTVNDIVKHVAKAPNSGMEVPITLIVEQIADVE